MTDIVPFEFPITGQQMRTVLRHNELWFVAKDVCDVIGISKYRDAVAQLDEDERASMPVDTPGGPQQMTVISEPGLYSLMMISRSPLVKPFRRWVIHEVLPAIRRTGSYAVTPAAAEWKIPTSYAGALLLAAEMEMNRVKALERAEVAEAQMIELEPAAEAWSTLASANGDYSVREAAYILNRDPVINTGERRLFASIREYGMVSRGDRPYARHSKHLTLRPRTYTDERTGEERTAKPQLRVTVEGLQYVHRRLGGRGVLQLDAPENSRP